MDECPVVDGINATSWNIWIFARPLSGNGIFPASAMAVTSHGYFHLCHWGVFLTRLSIVDVKAIVLRQGLRWTEFTDFELGVMWELHQLHDHKSTVDCTNPFLISTLKTQWTMCSGQYMGVTSYTLDEIQLKGNQTKYIRSAETSLANNQGSSRLCPFLQ